ncbi:MAG: hypothetical protein HY860_01775 [Chlamydiales bacterium]|nr:hypothetical protein [Chlamydiales bacterium]
MKYLFMFCTFYLNALSSLNIMQEAEQIAEKIWQNECGGTVDGLTTWNKGENFPSLGIGHFIWYPTGIKEPFEETFPSLLLFLQTQGAVLPTFLKEQASCPWNTRDEFYSQIESINMKQLRQFLVDTKKLQAIFIANRLENILPDLVKNLLPAEKEKITTLFYKLANHPKGLYALIDYVNFKGSGLSPTESYKGQGWGLLQVLQNMHLSTDIVQDFVVSAKEILTWRTKNAPSARGEDKWLKGWFNRLDTYTK